ncbi:hypothetical protein GCM10027049_04400 [Mucilaginibacter puniceus]
MKNLLALIALLILFPCFLSAQTNFKPGYIVNLKGDTIPGFVDYKDWTRNPKEVNFKSNNAENSQIYSAKDIEAFAVTGVEYYKSYNGKISLNRVDFSNFSVKVDTTYITDAVFLRGLTAGKNVTLLQYSDGIKDRYFIAQKNNPTTELIYRAYLGGNDRVTKVFDTKYKQQLQLLRTIYRPDDASLINEIQYTNYNQKALLKIVKKLNNGVDELTMVSQSKSGVRFFAGAGVNAGTISFKDNITLLESSNTSIGPMINVGLDLLFNKNIGKLFLRTELSYTSTKTRLAFGDGLPPSAFSTTNIIMFDRQMISLSPQLLYNISNKQNLKFYAGGGLVLTLSLYNNKQVYRDYNNTKASSSYNLQSLLPVNVTLVAKTGVTINNKIEIQVAYQPPVAINSATTIYVFKSSSFRAGINYLF